MSLTKVKAGNILLTTPSASSNDVTPATTQYVTTAIDNLVDTAPSTLNTLNELAAALGDDVNFSTTVTNSIATKLPLAGGTLTGTLTVAGSSSGTVDALIITNTDTTNNGLSIGVDSSENAFFWNGSNTSMNFATNNTLALTLDASQNATFPGVVTINRSNSSISAPDVSDHSLGTRIELYNAGTDAWYAIGVQSDTMWFNSDNHYRFYTDAVSKVDFDGNGVVNAVGGYKVNGTTAIDSNGISAHVGTSAPSSPSAGKLWFDTTSGVNTMKVYNGSAWNTMSNKFNATGGTYSTYISGGVQYGVHTFLSSGTFTPDTSGTIDVMMVAGGGGGGAWVGSGGGAGGMIVRPGLPVLGQAYTITVGAGGAGGYNPGGYAGMPFVRTGSDTTAFGLTAKGGGAGVSYSMEYAGGVGGSGSGGANNASHYASNAGNQTSQSGDSGTYGFGNAGGTAPAATGDPYPCAGGGGAGGVGGNSTTSVCGNGGVGKANNYRTGSNIYYAGGGGGGHHEGTPTYSSGGNGGGGAGNSGGSRINAVAGTANTGGGGGGGGGNGGSVSSGAAGGSGIVVVRYAI